MNDQFAFLGTDDNRSLRHTSTILGIALLINLVCLQFLREIPYLIFSSGEINSEIPDSNQLWLAVTDGLVYALSFIIPVVFIRITLRGRSFSPGLSVVARPSLFLIIPAVIGINYGAAYFNSVLTSFIKFDYYAPDLDGFPSLIVAEFISTALVPAIFEELLMRGCVLGSLLRYSKTGAILFSASVFSLMHANPAQFLYTFAAGILLGTVYVMTGSVWPGVIIHFFNNFLSIVSELEFENSEFVVLFADLTVMLAGFACLSVIVLRYGEKIRISLSDRGEGAPGFWKQALRPTVIVYAALSVALALFEIFAVLFLV